MKINFDKEKSAELLSNFVQGSVELGKKAANTTKKTVNAIVEKSKNDNYLRQLKKYNPLFPDQFRDSSFNLPNIIVIVDDAVRRGIDVCEGAIGWLSTDSGAEILHLYDEFVPSCGLTFIPAPVCDAIYYVDNFDRSRFIKVDCIFNKAHEERMAELKHIAFSLGAKRCSIKIVESVQSTQNQKKFVGLKENAGAVPAAESTEREISTHGANQRSGHIEVEFEGNSAPTVPTLKWFAHEDTIKHLVEIRCSGNNSIKTETLELAGTASSTMSQKAAHTLDCAINNMGANATVSMNESVAKEQRSKLIFSIEF